MSALEVDGDRPAVAWVSELPADWLTPAERLILFAIACDSYDGYSAAPGNPNLVAWTGLQQSYLRATISRLCEPTAKRPALLRKKDNKGRKHATLVFIRDALPAKPADTVGTLAEAEPADTVGTLDGADGGEPAYKPAYKPADTVGTSLSLIPKQGAGAADVEGDEETDEWIEESTSTSWWSCHLVEDWLGLARDDLSHAGRQTIVRRMLRVPYDQRPGLVAIAGRPPPKRVLDPLRFVLARIDDAEQRLNGRRPA
jgi:hypothetical protein